MKWVKRCGIVVTMCLAACGAYQLWPRPEPVVNVYHETDFTTAPAGIVGFPSFNAKTGQDFVDAGVNVPRQTSGGTLVIPDAASAENRVPAMVILHGSGGAWGGRSVNLAMDLARRGIAGFAVDTFTARNLRSTDEYLARLSKAPIQTQMADALNALLALQDHPFIDSDRIGVTGFSLGAGSTLYMMFEPVIENVLGKDGPRFSAYAMFYGGCMVEFDDFRVEGSPVLIMMGGADESMSIPGCERFRDKLQGLGVSVKLVVYPSAGHGWDTPAPQQFVDGAISTRDCVMRWTKDAETIETTSGFSMDNPLGAFRAISACATRTGYTMGFNRNAFDASRVELLNFLRATWNLQEPSSPAIRPRS